VPYLGISDPNLPVSVQKLPKALRELWVRVFNENYDAADEGKTFKIAWGVVRKIQTAQKAREMVPIDLDDVRPWLLGEKATKTDGGRKFSSSAYLFVPDAEKPSTWKIRIEETPGNVTVTQLGRAAAALSNGGFRGNPTQDISDERSAMAKKLIGLYRKHDVADADIPDYLFDIAGVKPRGEKAWAFAPSTSFKAYQQPDGRTRWSLITSGAFEDRDGEILSHAYLADALEYAEASGHRGTLNFWHVKNSDIGVCDFQMLMGQPGLLFETGLFDDTPAGRKAAAYYTDHAPETGASLEFLWIDRTPDGVYNPPGVIVRRSLLPRSAAAFPWSIFSSKESLMAKNKSEQVAELAKVLDIGEDEAAKMVAHLESGAKSLADYGVNWKEVSSESADTASVVTDDVATDAQPPALDEETVVTETVVAETVEESAETTVETEAIAEEPVAAPAAAPEAVEVVFTPETISALAEQVMATVEGKLTELRTALADMAKSLTDLAQGAQQTELAMTEIKSHVKSLQESDEAKISAAVKNLPRATVKSMQMPERPSQRQPDPELAKDESMLAKAKATLYG